MGARKDEDRLVSVGKQDLLILALWPRIEPDDSLLPFFDFLDHPGTILQQLDTYAITDGRQVPRARSLFQPSAQLTDNRARLGLYSEETGLGPNDQTLKECC